MASKQENVDSLFQEAIRLHKEGVDGDQTAVEKAYQLLKKIKLEQPNNALVEAYFGSITTLKARDHPNLMEKSKIAKKGLSSLDRAVQKDPNNIDIRILRGNVCYRLPEMYFKRTKTAIQDFSFLINSFEKNKKGISKDLYFQLLFDLGMAYQNIGNEKDAVSVWDQLLKLSPGTKYQNIIKNERRGNK